MIPSFDFLLPTKIRYGAGSLQYLAEELRLLNARRVMVITDRGLSRTELVGRVTGQIAREGIDFVLYDEIEANPKDRNVEACAERARAEAIDTLVALGGGSPIDAAKAVAVLARQGGSVRSYQGKGKIGPDCLPLLTIPTTAGTGSEVTFSSVITDTTEHFKFTIKSTAIAAKTAIIDPELTLTVPSLITAATGIDALTHAIEGYTANCTEPIGQFKNDNVMITNSVICCETREEARAIALREGRGYLVSMVNLYHDTMPKSQDGITWPSKPMSLYDIVQSGVDGDELLDQIIEGGHMLCGTPDEVSEQIARWGDVGMDQLVFGLPIEGLHYDEVIEVLELFGDKVIPEFDKDRKHSTDYYREQAVPKYGTFSKPLPDVTWPTVIPESALKPLGA